MNGATVIVATHAVNLLPWADQIIALGKTGRIVEQGTFAELNARDGSYVQSFALQGGARLSEKLRAEAAAPTKLGTSQSTTLTASVNDKARQMGDFSVYRYYFAASGRSSMIVFWALQVAFAFLETFPSIWLKWWSSATTNNEHPSTPTYLGVYAGLQIGSLVVLFFLGV